MNRDFELLSFMSFDLYDSIRKCTRTKWFEFLAVFY
jgi:hypothetical protein